MELSPHLTSPNPTIDTLARQTPPGMAFWAGTGPGGVTCRECRFFQHHKSYYAKGGKHRGELKPAACGKFRSMMQGRDGPSFAQSTPSCKYFERADAIPEAFLKS